MPKKFGAIGLTHPVDLGLTSNSFSFRLMLYVFGSVSFSLPSMYKERIYYGTF